MQVEISNSLAVPYNIVSQFVPELLTDTSVSVLPDQGFMIEGTSKNDKSSAIIIGTKNYLQFVGHDEFLVKYTEEKDLLCSMQIFHKHILEKIFVANKVPKKSKSFITSTPEFVEDEVEERRERSKKKQPTWKENVKRTDDSMHFNSLNDKLKSVSTVTVPEKKEEVAEAPKVKEPVQTEVKKPAHTQRPPREYKPTTYSEEDVNKIIDMAISDMSKLPKLPKNIYMSLQRVNQIYTSSSFSQEEWASVRSVLTKNLLSMLSK